MIMKTIDLTVSQLCEEIDYWKEQAEYYKKRYEDEILQRSIESKERLLEAQKGVANALMFALNVKDDAYGNLVITKENRKTLAKQFKD